MEHDSTSLDILFARSVQLYKTNAELIRLKTIRKTSDIASTSISVFVVMIIFWLAVIIGSIGMSLWIGELLGKSFYGFLIVSACYIIIALFILIFRNQWIKYPLNKIFISELIK
jgi:hypothetical protein